MSDNINFDYKNLSPFKWFVLENFPFIEADFDAITEWQLFSKIGKEINKIIDSQNIVGEQAETLTNAFNNLNNYVNNYFNNLDVQEEVNNKLNEMVQDGTLAEIINQEILLELNNSIDLLFSNATIFIGDSYGDPNVTGENNWVTRVTQKMNLTLNQNAFNFCVGGAGFTRTNNTFLANLQSKENIITNKKLIKNIIVCGGYNDRFETFNNINVAIQSFMTYCKQNYPNAQVYIGMIGNNSGYDNYEQSGDIQNIRWVLLDNVLRSYQYSNNYGATYLNGVEYVMHYYPFFTNDNVHPNDLGNQFLANAIYQSFKTGYYSFNTVNIEYSINNYNTVLINTTIKNNKLLFNIAGTANLIEPISQNQGLIDIPLGKLTDNTFLRFTYSRYSLIPCNILVEYGSDHNDFDILPAYLFISLTGELTVRLFIKNIDKKQITALHFRNNDIILDPLLF